MGSFRHFDPLLPKEFDHRLHRRGISFLPTNRIAIDRAAHLLRAGGGDRTADGVKFQASRIPRQPAMQQDQQAGGLRKVFGIVQIQFDCALHPSQCMRGVPGFRQGHGHDEIRIRRQRFGATGLFGDPCGAGKIALRQRQAGIGQQSVGGGGHSHRPG